MNKMNEKTRRNILLQLLFLAALIGATFWWLLRDCDVETMLATLKNATPWLIGLGLLCMGMYLFCGGSSAAVLFHGMGRPMGPLRRLKYHLIEFFFSAITPSSSGGQPFEVLFMRLDGYKVTESTVVLLVVAVLYKIAMLVLFFSLYFLNFAFLHAQVAGIWFLFLLGLFLNVAVIVIILLALYAQKAMRRLCGGCLRLLSRLRVVRRQEAAQEKLDAWLASFHDCAGFMRAHPWPVIKSFCIVLFQRVLYLLIPWCVYEAMGLSGVTVWQMMGLQLLLSVSVEMMPLPGAVGISESVSLVLYDAIFGAQFRYPAVILTRGISYYLPLLVSGMVTLGTRVSQLRGAKRGNDARALTRRGTSAHGPAGVCGFLFRPATGGKRIRRRAPRRGRGSPPRPRGGRWPSVRKRRSPWHGRARGRRRRPAHGVAEGGGLGGDFSLATA